MARVSSSWGSHLASALAVGGLLAGIVSCGSRTGLFGPEPDFFTGDAGRDANADAGPDGIVPCVPGRFTFELALTQLMFVVDRSRSMRFTLEGDDNVPRRLWRWTLLQNALRRTIVSFDDQIAMGAKFFPEELTPADGTSPQRSCRTEPGIGIAPKRGNAQAILDVFDDTIPLGGTPTAPAIRSAASFLTQTRSTSRTIILATDGAPNCNGALDGDTCICTGMSSNGLPVSCAGERGRYSCLDDDGTIGAIRDTAEDLKIPVYVIGIGGLERPEFMQVLDEMAVAGGRPLPGPTRHYNVQSESELTVALESIRDSAAKCTYLTPSAPTDPDSIAVEIDGISIPRDQTKTNGWDWVDKAFGELAFFGPACALAQGADGPPAVVTGVVTCDE